MPAMASSAASSAASHTSASVRPSIKRKIASTESPTNLSTSPPRAASGINMHS